MLSIETAAAWPCWVANDPVHGFDHVLRVYRMGERLSLAEGADLEIVRAAALLHDAHGSIPGQEGDQRAEHHQLSAEFARQILNDEGWPEQRIAAVQHCIRAHRYRDNREPPATIEAKVIFDADKLDVLGAIGVARVIGYAVQAGEPVFSQPSEQFLRTGHEEPGEPHSTYHEYLFKLSKVKDRLFTATARKIAEERDTYLRAYYQRLMDEFAGLA